MKLIAYLGQYEWSPWAPNPTYDCSVTCGNGTRPYQRYCDGAPDDSLCEGFPDAMTDMKRCNEHACPEWSEYGPYSECTKICNSGTKYRNRTCSTGDAADCSGNSWTEVRCNTQPCELKMEYWENRWPSSMVTGFLEANISDGFFQGFDGNTVDEKCGTYCLSVNECFAMTTTHFDTSNGIHIHCFIFYDNFFAEEGNSLNCWGSTCDSIDDTSRTRVFGILRDRHVGNSSYLPSVPADGYFNLSYHEIDGVCGVNNNSAFGEVDFRRTFNFTFETNSNENIIKEVVSETYDCAAECFNKAGCTAFFEINNECHQIIGPISNMIENNNVGISGLLTNFCPNSAFTSTFSRYTDFFCLLQYDEIEDLTADKNYVDDVIYFYYSYYYNDIDFPLNTWNFEPPSGSPLKAISQYVTIQWPTAEDLRNQPTPYNGYAWYKFIVDTNIRTQTSDSERKRRSTSANDILEDLQSLEDQAISYIMTNPILPAGISVLSTTPPENIYTRQIAMDGSIAADCSTGSCQCSPGIVDNGNGCVEVLNDDVENGAKCNPFSFTCNQNDLEVRRLIEIKL